MAPAQASSFRGMLRAEGVACLEGTADLDKRLSSNDLTAMGDGHSLRRSKPRNDLNMRSEDAVSPSQAYLVPVGDDPGRAVGGTHVNAVVPVSQAEPARS